MKNIITIFIIFGCLMSGYSQGDQINSRSIGLLNYWMFNENTGAVIYDSVGNNKGAITGATWTIGKFGSCLTFAANNLIQLTYVSMTPTSTYTFIFWCKTLSNGAAANPWYGNTTLFSCNSSGQYSMFGERNGCAYVGVYPGSYLQGTKRIDDNKWHCVVFVSTGATAMHIYVDGVLDINGAITIGTTGGSRIGNASDGNGYSWIGKIDEVAKFNIALTKGEIQAIYDKGIKGKK